MMKNYTPSGIFKPLLQKLLLFALLVAMAPTAHGQLTVTTSTVAADLARKLVGSGVVVTNPTITCPSIAAGIFAGTSNLGFDSGIVLTSGAAATTSNSYGVNAPYSDFADNVNGAPGDPTLDSLIVSTGNSGNDACILEFDFKPAGDTVRFNYVFGSEEYTDFTCTGFNDVFGFFISGPGYPNPTNIALVPGTQIPVAVNSVNQGPTGGGDSATCAAMGPGSPFHQYYRWNLGNTIVYDGLTTVMTAIAAVSPCNTYHLKMGVEDVGDDAYDSGVFLQAGSLNSNAPSISSVGGGGLSLPVPYCVRGCLPGQFIFTRAHAADTSTVIRYQIAGNAVNGVDYSAIADSVVIPANDSFAILDIQGLVTGVATGPRVVQLNLLAPGNCDTSVNIIGTASLTIYDSIYVDVTTPDTAICLGDSVLLQGNGDNILSYQWSPAATVSNDTALATMAHPTATTTYILSASLANSGCPTAHDQVTITVAQPPVINVGPDRVTCVGTPVQLNPTITPANQTYHIVWSPATYLNNDTILSPISNPTSDVDYIVTASPANVLLGCSGSDTIHIHVLPNDFTLSNHDTAICKGATIAITALGDTSFAYSWTPTDGISNPAILSPTITPDTSNTYTITATYPGCPDIVHSLSIDVQPNPVVVVGSSRTVCQFDTLHFNPSVSPGWYTNYHYSWTPTGAFFDDTLQNTVFRYDSSTEVVLTVTTPAGCTGIDSAFVTVHQGNFASLLNGLDTAVCPGDSVKLMATGGAMYQWSPGIYMNDSTSGSPVVYPIANQVYTALVTDSSGCLDTLYSNISVHPSAVVSLPDTVTIYPGETYQMDPQGNCVSFAWFPPLGLTADNISNPIASPPVNTRYIVHAATEYGCTAIDTIVVMADPNTLLALPNAFTPGNGPDNDLKIIKRGIATLKYFRIFNRWGVQVFQTTNIDEGWDGTFNGSPQPFGVYVYMLEAETNTGQPFVKQGNVTLIR